MAIVKKNGRSGTREWLFQRIANLAIILYSVVLLILILAQDEMHFEVWQTLFSAVWFKVYSTLTLFIVAMNSVLAGWQIGADYIKPIAINRIYMGIVIGGTCAYLVVGNAILWL